MTSQQENEYIAKCFAYDLYSIDIEENSIIVNIEDEAGNTSRADLNLEQVCCLMSSMNPMTDFEYQPEHLKNAEEKDLILQAANDILDSFGLVSTPYFCQLLN